MAPIRTPSKNGDNNSSQTVEDKPYHTSNNRRSARLAEKASNEVVLDSQIPEDPSKKRKYDALRVELLAKKPRLPPDLRDDQESLRIKHWCTAGTWPKEASAMNQVRSDPRLEMLATEDLSRKRSIGGNTITSWSAAGDSSQETKTTEDESNLYIALLEDAGYYVSSDLTTPEPCKEDLEMIQSLLDRQAPLPVQSRFDDTNFKATMRSLQYTNEGKVTRYIGELLFPGPRHPCFDGFDSENLVELVDETWYQAKPILATRPKPDVSVAFERRCFTDTQLAQLRPYIGIAGAESSFFAATQSALFPFIGGEIEESRVSLNVADKQNSQSMFWATRAIVKLHVLAGCDEKDLHQRVLAFSVAHNNDQVRIHAYYPIFQEDGKKMTYHRYQIKKYFLASDDGKDRWTAFRFVANVYRYWAPGHLDRIRSLVDKILPIDMTDQDGL